MSIIINNLTKRYGNKTVLDNICYSFDDNKIYFIVGINGVGKSTLYKAILRQIHYQGEIIINGKISYIPEEPFMPALMSVKSFLKNITNKTLDLDQKIDYYLNYFNINDVRNKELGMVSKGTKQKINIIQALISPSDILIIDEPLNGLDKESQKLFMNLLKNIKNNKLIIFVSHQTCRYKFDNLTNLILKDGKLWEK